MTFTKKRKIYGLVLGVAAAAFLWDRSTGGDKPPGAEGPLLIHATATPQRSTPAVAVVPGAPVKRGSVAQRLRQVASLARLNPESVDSAFAVPSSWLAAKTGGTAPEQPVVTVAAPVVPPGKEFGRRHRLDAVMMRPKGGYAIVDGQGVFVGQQVERFRLESIKQNSAVFVWNDERIELTIIRPEELMLDGSIISNRGKGAGGEAGVDLRPAGVP